MSIFIKVHSVSSGDWTGDLQRTLPAFKYVTRACRGQLVPSSLWAACLALLADSGHPLSELITSEEGLPLLFVMLGQANTRNPWGWCLSDALLLTDTCSIPAITSVLFISLWKGKFTLFNSGPSQPTKTVLLLFCDTFVLFLKTCVLLSNCEWGTQNSSYIHSHLFSIVQRITRLTFWGREIVQVSLSLRRDIPAFVGVLLKASHSFSSLLIVL